MGGFLIPFAGVLGMVLFSISIFFNLGLTMVWLYLELASLCLIPLFFSGSAPISFSGLFYYVVFSGASSGLLLMGVLLPECLYFLLGGLLVKFGVFPFWGWVYRVCSLSGWVVVWGFSTLLKVSFVLFSLFLVLSVNVSGFLVFLCSIGCLLLSIIFWVYVSDWKVCWCHIMLSSSMALVAISVSGGSLGALLGVFLFYALWASLVILFLSFQGTGFRELEGGFLLFSFCFLLLTLPVSLPVFYKILLCSSVFTTGFIFMTCWVVYSVSEQLYLFMLVTGLYSSVSWSGASSYV